MTTQNARITAMHQYNPIYRFMCDQSGVMVHANKMAWEAYSTGKLFIAPVSKQCIAISRLLDRRGLSSSRLAEVFVERGALLKPVMRYCYALSTVIMDAAVQVQRLCLHCETSLHGASTQVRITFLSIHIEHSHCTMALAMVPCLHTWDVIQASFCQ